MSDYLNSLVARTLRSGPVVQPRPVSLFEPMASGPFNEPVFAGSETRATQEIPSPAPRVAADLSDLPDTPVRRREHVSANEPPHAVLQSQTMPSTLLPAQVTPPSPFPVNAIESPREVRDEEMPRRSTETDSITPADETRHHPTPSLIKPEVRIISPTTDRAPVQPPLTTPPLASMSGRTRNVNAQAAEAPEAPESVVVTIGRIDVRAIFAPPQAVRRANRTQPQPMSLDEYLKQRSEGRR